jgi:branched-chain amino acid transport system permease protein
MKAVIFVYAGLLAALSGWLFAHLQRAVNPTPFSLNQGIEYLFMAVVGGAGHVWGAVLGATVFTVLKDVLQDMLPTLLGASGNFEGIVFGVVMVFMLQYARDGLCPMLQHLFPTEPAARAPDTAAPLARRGKPAGGQCLLAVNRVRKEFGGLVAVNDVCFHVQAGEIVGLIGPNGAGKSITFDLITGLLPVTGGEVCYRGEVISGLCAQEIIKRGVARTFQHVQLLPTMTVLENVAIGAHLRGQAGLLPHPQGGVISAMLRLNRQEEACLLYEARIQLERVGLNASLYNEAGSLPLGQQRLLEIARALCGDPALLLLDEPAAGLRFQEKQALAELLRQLNAAGLSLLLVEHDMEFVMHLADRLVVMEFGTKIAAGTPELVPKDPVVLEAYLGGVE